VEFRDYYETLGVPRTATQAEIKKAFRKLARQHHPDVKPGDAAAEGRFKAVNEANEVLSDPDKRKRYDVLGADWEKYAGGGRGAGGTGRPGGAADPFGPGGPFAGYARPGSGAGPGGARYEFRSAPGGDAGFSDFFRTFFGGGMAGGDEPAAGGPRAAGRVGPQTRTSTASIDDLLGGLGYQTGTAGYPAGAFGADGYDASAADGRRVAGGRGGSRTVEAPVEISLHEAATGTTRIVQLDEARLEVKIPRGADTGSRIRLRGKGGGGRDLVLVVKVTPHPSFTRRGADLIRELPVTLREALLGAEVPIATLDGRVLLKVPPGTQNGRTIRLKGKGLPHLRGEGRGDLLAKVKVVLPTHLSDEAKAAAGSFCDLAEQPDPRGP
jgi:DnaJ-class molecular chaperone